MKQSLEDIQKTVVHLLAYTRGGRVRKAEDLATKHPIRIEFLVSDILTMAGGRSEFPEARAKYMAEKEQFTWTEGLKSALATSLAAVGITLTPESWTPPDYSTPTRKKIMEGSDKKVRRLKGKPW